MLRAVLFDLDDTLFDHEACAREALRTVHQAHRSFTLLAFAEFERAHREALEELHAQVVAGQLALDTARVARFRRLFEIAGAAPEDVACQAARQYRSAYVTARRAVAGAQVLLAALRPRVRIAVISNNVLAEQQEKMRVCGLEPYVDALVVSEETGIAKPDPAIFHLALERVDCRPDEAVMIGDSWIADIAGAAAAGIPAIWFNRRRLLPPDPDASVPQLHAFEPIEDALHIIFQPHRAAGANRR
jgi:HAD superfamily hydrolase (TIGR01549 family)